MNFDQHNWLVFWPLPLHYSIFSLAPFLEQMALITSNNPDSEVHLSDVAGECGRDCSQGNEESSKNHNRLEAKAITQHGWQRSWADKQYVYGRKG